MKISPTTTWNTDPRLPPIEEVVHRAAWKAGVLGSLNFAATVLAARLIVLVAVLGAIALAALCLPALDLVRVALLGVYCAGVMLPVVWLNYGRG